MALQFELFEDNQDEDVLLSREVKDLKERHDSTRKALFARFDHLCKVVLKQQQMIEELNEQVFQMAQRPAS